MGNFKNSTNSSCCRFDPIQLALIGAFITLVGDFLAFLAAFAVAQNACEEKNKNEKQSQADANKIYAENKIKELEYEIHKLKKEVSDFS